MRAKLLTIGLAFVVTGSVVGQARPADSVTVAAGAKYRKGGTYRFFFGSRYRDLWTTPIRVPVLDLQGFAGGLRPLQRGGGKQTKSLRFMGADGRQYQFRSVDKDPTAVLPEDLKDTFADRIFQDQISAGHPAGALLVSPILQAAGVLHAPAKLVVMPDAPALGEFRAEFANMLGTIEERPRDDPNGEVSFAGARKIVGSDDLFKELEDDPMVRVDTRAFLAARLVDIFLGDWDRHRDQWRWALLDDAPGPRWLPIPRDRDQAFVRFDGFLLGFVRKSAPQLTNFGPDYPPMVGATWNGRDLDRRVLTDLERPVWDSVAVALQAKLTDEVIDAAVAGLPPEYAPLDGDRLRSALRARRDGLRDMAADYYRLLARDVDIHASDRADEVRVERQDERLMNVTVSARGQRYYRRQFDRTETDEVRVYLHGGDDRAVVRGAGTVGIMVRFIGGGGDDFFADSASMGPARFYDERGTGTSIGRGIDRRPYQEIDDTTNPTAVPHRDWGRHSAGVPLAFVSPDLGFQFGFTGRTQYFGFRKKPWASRFGYSGLVALGAQTGRLSLTYRRMGENSKSFWGVEGLASGTDVLRWYGFGNETTIDPDVPISFYRVSHLQFSLEPSIGWVIGERGHIAFGPRLKFARTDLSAGSKNATRFIGVDQPFGTQDFAQMGFGADLDVDTRDMPAAARSGVRLQVEARGFPAFFDADHAFGSVRAEASTYLTARIPMTPTLALNAGGQKVWGREGEIPFYEAALLGSTTNLRGFRSNRFAGDDGALWGSAELRLHLTNAYLFIPGQQGVFGFYDVGRVYARGESSDEWHTSVGGGIWLGFLTRGSVATIAMAHSVEGNRIHARLGFAF